MNKLASTIAAMSLAASAGVDAAPATGTSEDARVIAPRLYAYTRGLLFGDLWKREQLSPRDRSVVTLSALVAGGHTGQLPGHVKLGLDNGVKPSEISALITHLAFYTGWPNAIAAVGVAKDVFEQRGIKLEEVPATLGAPLVPEPASEARRAASVDEIAGEIAPGLAAYTNEVLFGDVWQQDDLTARDRSLITMAALIARGNPEQLPFHLNRAMDNGLTQEQAAEVITHLAFYAGWPRAMSALPVAKTVFASRKG